MAIEVKADGRFGNYLYTMMERNQTDIKDLAKDIESTYEHIRKLIKGLAYPSQFMLDNLSKGLKGFDKKEALLFVEQDKAQKKMKNYHLIAGTNPELDPIEKVWLYLSPEHKKTIYTMVDAFAKEDRGRRQAK